MEYGFNAQFVADVKNRLLLTGTVFSEDPRLCGESSLYILG
jgi:hypothetical protein